jgi:hypothetical protein
MVISEKSQLGLRFKDRDVKRACLVIWHDVLTNMVNTLDKQAKDKKYLLDKIQSVQRLFDERGINEDTEIVPEDLKQEVAECELMSAEQRLIDESISGFEKSKDLEFVSLKDLVFESPDERYFYICKSVYEAAELVRISENFTGRTLKDIKPGKYVYLMGKHEMVKFAVNERGVKGFYYDDKAGKVFEWGVEKEDGRYFFTPGYVREFTTIMQILVFIELGDISVRYINSLQKIKGKTKEESDYNATKHTVHIVDSTWNQILVRTDGFAVRGHFKLQPCGTGLIDRKLIWVNAYEKNGYVRKPKATIVRD